MGIYRKEGKQEAYTEMLEIVSAWSDERIAQRFPFSRADLRTRIFQNHTIAGKDFDDVAAKAIRVERGRRIGKTAMTKKSFDLNAIDCGMLTELQAELGHSTEVATLRAAIHALYTHTFG